MNNSKKKYYKYIPLAVISIVLLFIQAISDLKLPNYMADIVDKGIVTGDQSVMISIGIKMLLLALLIAVVTILSSLTSSVVGSGVASNLRDDVFRKVEKFSHSEFDKFGTASLITRTTNDIQQVQMFLTMLLKIVSFAPIMGIGGVIMALQTSPELSWVIAVAVAVMLVFIVFMFLVAFPKFKIVQKLIDKVNLITRENLTGMMVIRAFNTEKHEEERFDKANKDLTKVNLFVNRLMVLMMPIMTLVMNGTTVAVMYFGSDMINTGSLEIGKMMSFIQYAMHIIMSFLFVSMSFIMIPRAVVSYKRIKEILDTDITIENPANPVPFSEANKGIIEFRDVTFSYPGADEPVLHNITFSTKKGETTAFIGSTGSGKSTLINLIPRFYDVTQGEIYVDGVNVKNADIKKLRNKIGYIPQKGVLFSGTIESNIAYADPENISREDAMKAAKIAQAEEFINTKEEGYETPIAQGGGNVSGGQKQRLSIARALAKKPEFFIFDDSFSALDFKTDAALRKALKENIDDATILIVAQRISTIMNAEQIVVLDEGRIVGKGTHDELMKNCEVYREIAYSQLSKEELA